MASSPAPATPVDTPRKMTFDDLLIEAGGFGGFQVTVLSLLCIPRLIIPLFFLQHIFISAVPPHHCAIPNQRNPGNLSQEDLLLIHIPQQPDGTFSSCKMYSQPHFILNRSQEIPNGSAVQSCDHGWQYDLSTFSSTTVTQWDLVCERRGLSKALATLFFIGVMVGSVVFGYLSDRYGRRVMLLVSLLLTLVFGGFCAGSVSYPMYAASLTLTGCAIAGCSILVTALCVEWVDSQHRTDAAVVISFCWSIGSCTLALLAYLLRDWRWLMVTITAPCALGLLALWWLPESARWLLTKGRVEEAELLLMRCAAVNGRSLDAFRKNSESIRALAKAAPTSEDYSYIDLLRTPRLWRICLHSGLLWFAVAFSYYGMSLNVAGLGLDVYLTHFLYALIEFPAKLSIYFLLERAGRRWTQLLTLLLSGVCMAAAIAIPHSLGSFRLAVAIIGKGFSEATFTALVLYTAELYPTVLRQNGSGYTAFMGRAGASLAPLVMMLDGFWHLLPQVIFCAAAVIGSAVAGRLPETRNTHLPETIRHVEDRSFQDLKNGGSLQTPSDGERRGSGDAHSDVMESDGGTPHQQRSATSLTPHQ